MAVVTSSTSTRTRVGAVSRPSTPLVLVTISGVSMYSPAPSVIWDTSTVTERRLRIEVLVTVLFGPCTVTSTVSVYSTTERPVSRSSSSAPVRVTGMFRQV